ncbi:TonB-dependent receptor [Novosphingobium sp. SL115]|uniref:TonB-dependent receptor n=1 Tax=Novosphingobium sp. SL115 TaxID=2995150 RepID=UPI0022747954|nr:TonB-dependent receptor [Novosphingobium sp. SL115]MCY1672827.1 TonB-dependent receptor [Novosphingobium sp. SL115]
MRDLLAATALTTLAAFASPALAQDAAQDGGNDSGIGEIVVTAQKRSENIQNVPIAISALGSQYLESRGITSIDNLGTLAPNVKFERAPSSKTISQIAIRGSVTINPAITWEPAVGLYLNGVYIAKAQGSIFDVADLERVEILRGPQGTLYGRNALAGAVNLIPKAPSGEAGGRAEVSYGNYNELRLKGVVDLPRMGIFSAKVSGQYVRRDGLVDIVPNPVAGVVTALPNAVSETDTVRSGSVMVQIRAELSDAITADYTYDYSRQNQTPPFAQLLRVNRNGDPRDIFDPNSPSYPFAGAVFPLDRYTNPDRATTASINEAVYEKSRSYGHALTLAADLGDATLKSITAYRDLAWSDGLDLDGSPTPVAFTQRITDYWAFSQELQLTGQTLSDTLKYVVGAFYFKERAETSNPQTYFGGGTDLVSDYGSRTEAFALYAQADYNVTDAFKLTLGARYTHEKKDIRRFFKVNFDAQNGVFAPTVIADLPYGTFPDAKYNDFSPAITASYEVNSDVNVYARFARGFKSGGFNGETNVFFDPNAPAGCPSGATELCQPYRPEKVDSYELGLKTKMLGGKVIFNVAAFRDEHKDMQLSIFTATSGAASIVRNAAGARIQGLEFETVIRPVDGVTLNGSLALLDSKYKRFIEFDATANNGAGANVDVSNNRAFPHAPKVTASGGFDVRVARGDWGRFNLYGDVSYVSSYYTFPYALSVATASDQSAANTKSKGRTVVNLRAAVAEVPLGGGTAEIALWVRNLTKESDPSNFIDFGPGFGGLTLGYFPDPRMYGLTVGMRF